MNQRFYLSLKIENHMELTNERPNREMATQFMWNIPKTPSAHTPTKNEKKKKSPQHS